MTERTQPRDPFVGALALALGQNDPEKFGGKPPIACCPDCSEPLVATMLFPKYEFICAGGCGRLWTFVDPVPKTETKELRERLEKYEHAFLKGAIQAEAGARGLLSRALTRNDRRRLP